MGISRALLSCPLFESYTRHISDLLASSEFDCFAEGREAIRRNPFLSLPCPADCVPLTADQYHSLKEVAYINDEATLSSQAWKALLVCVLTGLVVVSSRSTLILLKLFDVNIGRGVARFALEFAVSMLPMLLSMLDLGGFEIWTVLLSVAVAANLALIWWKIRRKQPPRQEIELQTLTPYTWRVLTYVDDRPVKHGNHWEFISLYRAYLMSQTCIAIFAVDFFLFPRDQGKCEAFGMSVMDLGVGIVILSSGIVSRAARTTEPVPVLQSIFSHWPLILIGVLRFVSTWLTSYYVPTSEYGVHWNFFLTIAVSGVGSALLVNRVVTARRAWILALAMLCCYQIYLSALGGETFILFGERDNFFSMNREGILGSIGFLALTMIGVSLGSYLLFDERFPSMRQKFWLVAAPTAACGVLTFALDIFLGVRPSRRMANLPFVLCVTSFNLAGVLTLFLDELLVVHVSSELNWHVDDRSPEDSEVVDIDLVIWKGMHGSQLAIFLLANILCGLVNVATQTLVYNGVEAIVWNTAYMAAWSAVCFFFAKRNIVLKFW